MSAEPAKAKRILIVDDNEVILKTVSLKLQGAGYKVVTALDGAEAVAAVRREAPDLILLDISFPPDVGGVEWDGFPHHGLAAPAGSGQENPGHHHHRR
ncbi:MAG: response regulator [Limisphaerales bacterium]